MAKRIAVVVSQGQSQNPAKRALEENIVAALLMENGVEVTVIPHLYDLRPEGTGILALQGIRGDMIVLSWLYERASRWVLDRNGVRGREGQTLIKPAQDEDEDDDDDETLEGEQGQGDKQRVTDRREPPNRKIYCLDLHIHDSAQPYVDEIKRIAAEASTQVVELMGWIGGTPKPGQLERFLAPEAGGLRGNGASEARTGSPPLENAAGQDNGDGQSQPLGVAQPVRIDDDGVRRWYPVIDFSRCTNCMECIDFCLFGVYGVDHAQTILVEQPDNCRKGCPACSRVCPENAIIFPQHKTPAIAGALAVADSLKIDLSQLFGAPSAVEVAARERDEQLVLAGRDVVGMRVGIPKRQEGKSQEPHDDLDELLDQLDDLDL